MAADATNAEGEIFELFMLGGAVERRYRKMRPEVERLPWSTLDPSAYSPSVVYEARRSWTLSAFQEHRTAVACAATLRALIECRAPLDLIALATRFSLDELVHVELCARLAGELGGGTPLLQNPRALVLDATPGVSPLLEAAELIVRNFCVGEAISVPLLRGTWHATKHPLVKAVLGRIVKDEAAHGQFGWIFLDWAAEHLDDGARAHLGAVAARAIEALVRSWPSTPPRTLTAVDEAHALGWMEASAYFELARKSLETAVLAPLLARGIDPGPEA